MSQLDAYRARLDALLVELAGEHRLPGAVCGVLLEGEHIVVATGRANLATGVEVTPDTLFQLGSISKIHTTTLVMQAHAAGLVVLDEPVRSQLPGFAVGDPGATIEITPRHLLTHTSGIEGDHLVDTGWNPDALERYVATLSSIAQIHDVDDAYSFCNTGFGVAGRLVEEVTGENFDRALRRHLNRPLGCPRTLTLPQHLLLHRVASGHAQQPGSDAEPLRRWPLTRSNGPMGGLVGSADELLTFSRMHLDDGHTAAGVDVLPRAAVHAMQQPHVDTALPGESQALGWTVHDWGVACLGQDADTIGQRAFLRVVPSRRFAICLLTNSPTGALVARDLLPRVVSDLIDIGVPKLQAGATPHDHGSSESESSVVAAEPGVTITGIYERLHQRLQVISAGGNMRLTTQPTGVLDKLGVRPVTIDLQPLDPTNGIWVGTDPTTGVDELVVFAGTPGTPAAVLHFEGRLHRRTE